MGNQSIAGVKKISRPGSSAIDQQISCNIEEHWLATAGHDEGTR